MIDSNQLVEIGHVTKPHGIQGEMTVELDADGLDLKQLKCLVMDIDGIFVPFFVDTVRSKGAFSQLVRLDGVSNETEAAQFAGKTVYALHTDVDTESDDSDDEGFYMDDLVGFELYDTTGDHIGTIEDYDDTTDNTLFIVRMPHSADPVFVPAAADLIADVDTAKHTLTMDLPTGLI